MVVNHAALGSQFYPKLVQMTSELGMKPEDLLAVMVSESGINPAAHNPHGNASGLVQFMPDTLKGVGFNGNPNEFTALTGEEQLPYIKRLIEGNMRYNGAPFTSAAQYYVANFWPVALRLPGIKSGNPDTVIVEENPATITDRKTGQQVSAKYHAIGVNIDPHREAAAYKANPLFHGTTPGAITYGDMLKQVDKNKQTPAYRQALLAMQQSSGYQPSYPISATRRNMPPANLDSTLQRYLDLISTAETKKTYNRFLPRHDVLIEVDAQDYTNSIEFARVLCSALETELLATAYTHTDGKNIEVECRIAGPTQECHQAVMQLSHAIAQAFTDATYKVGGIPVKLHFILNKTSSYQPISLKTADTNYRTFQLKLASLKGNHNAK